MGLLSFGASSNEVPIIGILSHEADPVKPYVPNANHSSFISASYVKFIEAAGARAIPVWIGQDEEYYRNIVKYTNGLLLPGGNANSEAKNGYWDAGRTLYSIALEVNRNGDYYPIIGICLGMQLLAIVGAGEKSLTPCSALAIPLPVKFRAGFRSSKMFGNADERMLQALQTESITYNNHKYCVTPKNIDSSELANNWEIIATSVDKNGMEFIAIFENTKYPFYGLQFHPERNIFGHDLGCNIPRCEHAIKSSQYFTNFFIFESRKNGHEFPSWEEEHKSLIYNYQPIFVNQKDCSYEQLYMFK